MTESILIGPAITLTQNVVYAAPARQVRIISSRVLETSVDNSTFAAVTATTTGTDLTSVFVKCTTGSAIVVCRA